MHQRAALRGAAALLAAILLLGTAGCGGAAPETAATVPPTPLPAEEPEHAGECRILAEPSEEDGGTVTGGGIFAVGDKVTLTAQCAGGWAFAGWSHWGKIVSTAAVYTFTADRTAIYTAVFLPVGVPETTLFETDFEGAEPGPVEIGDWSGPFSFCSVASVMPSESVPAMVFLPVFHISRPLQRWQAAPAQGPSRACSGR